MVKNLIREGVVSSVDEKKCTARLTFPDRDGLVSAELAILQPAGAKNKYYALPDVGDVCLAIMFPNDENGSGVIIGSRYSDKCKTPAQNQNVSMIKFEDGTYLKYDRAKHELRINCVGKIYINGTQIRLND